MFSMHTRMFSFRYLIFVCSLDCWLMLVYSNGCNITNASQILFRSFLNAISFLLDNSLLYIVFCEMMLYVAIDDRAHGYDRITFLASQLLLDLYHTALPSISTILNEHQIKYLCTAIVRIVKQHCLCYLIFTFIYALTISFCVLPFIDFSNRHLTYIRMFLSVHGCSSRRHWHVLTLM